jgi:hypothetical protein
MVNVGDERGNIATASRTFDQKFDNRAQKPHKRGHILEGSSDEKQAGRRRLIDVRVVSEA